MLHYRTVARTASQCGAVPSRNLWSAVRSNLFSLVCDAVAVPKNVAWGVLLSNFRTHACRKWNQTTHGVQWGFLLKWASEVVILCETLVWYIRCRNGRVMFTEIKYTAVKWQSSKRYCPAAPMSQWDISLQYEVEYIGIVHSKWPFSFPITFDDECRCHLVTFNCLSLAADPPAAKPKKLGGSAY